MSESKIKKETPQEKQIQAAKESKKDQAKSPVVAT